MGSRRTWWCLGIGLLGVAARGWLWWVSIGSNDVRIWETHALHVLADGLAESYRKYQTFPQFNHPPLMALYAAQAQLWAGGNLLHFARLIKLPGLAGEALTMWALWRSASPRAFAVYACLPAAILVSGFHGNTDPLCAGLVLAAAIEFDKERFFPSGLLWSGALNVKLLPLVLIPLAFLGVPNRKALGRLTLGFALGMAPFVPAAMTAGKAMYESMVAYNSLPDNWGLMALFSGCASASGPGRICGAAREWWLVYGRFAVLLAAAGVGLLSRFRRRLPMAEQATLAAALFLLLAPGFGVQYVVFAAPLICLVDLRAGAWWGWTSGMFIAAVYGLFLVSWMPLESRVLMSFPTILKASGIAAWAVLAVFAVRHAGTAWVASPSYPRLSVAESAQNRSHLV